MRVAQNQTFSSIMKAYGLAGKASMDTFLTLEDRKLVITNWQGFLGHDQIKVFVKDYGRRF